MWTRERASPVGKDKSRRWRKWGPKRAKKKSKAQDIEKCFERERESGNTYSIETLSETRRKMEREKRKEKNTERRRFRERQKYSHTKEALKNRKDRMKRKEC